MQCQLVYETHLIPGLPCHTAGRKASSRQVRLRQRCHACSTGMAAQRLGRSRGGAVQTWGTCERPQRTSRS